MIEKKIKNLGKKVDDQDLNLKWNKRSKLYKDVKYSLF